MSTEINEEMWRRAEVLSALPFEVSVYQESLSDGGLVYVVSNPELPGCRADGSTQEEAEDNLRGVRKDFIYFLLADELPVPRPRNAGSISATILNESVTVKVFASVAGTATGTFDEGVKRSGVKTLGYFNVTSPEEVV